MLTLKKIKLLVSLSRLPHVLLDMATPALIAILALGKLPSLGVIGLGIITAFSGYTAIYALNDLLSVQVDRDKMNNSESYQGYAVESAELRHPIAQKILSRWDGWMWFGFWFIIAMIGAYTLSVVAFLILLASGVFEICYVALFKYHYLRFIISGIVKTCGPIAAIFAVHSVASSVSFIFIMGVFFWVFLWEIGGQNIPADWNDIEEDKKVHAKTVPIHFGERIASKIVLMACTASILFSVGILFLSPLHFSLFYLMMNLLLGIILILKPAFSLYKSQTDPSKATTLFNWASYYPLALLIMVCMKVFS